MSHQEAAEYIDLDHHAIPEAKGVDSDPTRRFVSQFGIFSRNALLEWLGAPVSHKGNMKYVVNLPPSLLTNEQEHGAEFVTILDIAASDVRAIDIIPGFIYIDGGVRFGRPTDLANGVRRALQQAGREQNIAVSNRTLAGIGNIAQQKGGAVASSLRRVDNFVPMGQAVQGIAQIGNTIFQKVATDMAIQFPPRLSVSYALTGEL